MQAAYQTQVSCRCARPRCRMPPEDGGEGRHGCGKERFQEDQAADTQKTQASYTALCSKIESMISTNSAAQSKTFSQASIAFR